jgi:anionic cell wall polymer biosynthesis LytR-Cps2A-Psr (LCP) family protein
MVLILKKGQQVMDGHVLLQYARFRMDEEGDFGRVRRQQQVMSAVMSQMKKPNDFIKNPRITWEISRLYVDRCAC